MPTVFSKKPSPFHRICRSNHFDSPFRTDTFLYEDHCFLCPPQQGRTSSVARTYILRLEDVHPRHGGYKTDTIQNSFLFSSQSSNPFHIRLNHL